MEFSWRGSCFQIACALAVAVAVAVAQLPAASRDLPKNFDKCQRDDNFDKCLVDAVNKAIVLLKDGNDDFGVPSLDPMAIDSLVIEAGSSAINLKQTLTNLQVRGMINNSKIKRYSTTLSNYTIKCDSITKRIEMIGNYSMNGKILLFPLRGNGPANITLININIVHHLFGERFERNGIDYMRLKDYKVVFKPERVFFNFQNLFNDAKLSEAMNQILNENWKLVFGEQKEGYAKQFGDIFRRISNKIFEKVPFNTIFPS